MGIERLQNKRQDKLFLSESYGSERQLKKRARTCRGMRHFTILKMQTEKTKSECIKRLHTDLENICMLEQKEKKKCAHPAGHTLYQGCHYLLSYKYILFKIKLKVLHQVQKYFKQKSKLINTITPHRNFVNGQSHLSVTI